MDSSISATVGSIRFYEAPQIRGEMHLFSGASHNAGPTMNLIGRSDVAIPSYRVRRRRYGGRVWLVLHNAWFEIDPLFDFVWHSAHAGHSFENAVLSTQRRFGWSLPEAIAGVTVAWVTLRDCDLLEIGAADPTASASDRPASNFQLPQ